MWLGRVKPLCTFFGLDWVFRVLGKKTGRPVFYGGPNILARAHLTHIDRVRVRWPMMKPVLGNLNKTSLMLSNPKHSVLDYT